MPSASIITTLEQAEPSSEPLAADRLFVAVLPLEVWGPTETLADATRHAFVLPHDSQPESLALGHAQVGDTPLEVIVKADGTTVLDVTYDSTVMTATLYYEANTLAIASGTWLPAGTEITVDIDVDPGSSGGSTDWKGLEITILGRGRKSWGDT